MFRGSPHGFELCCGIVYGLAQACFAEGAADPFARSQVLAPGETLDFGQFVVGEENLEALRSHGEYITLWSGVRCDAHCVTGSRIAFLMDMSAKVSREELRLSFRPDRVRVLFIGESPPASGRFFYARDSGLYRAMREAFQLADASIGDENFLAAFQASGCYLVDLCADPVDRLKAKARRAACVAGEASLGRTVAELRPAVICVLLRSIGLNVAEAIARAGWRGEVIQPPYPGRWVQHRQAFIEILTPVIAREMDRRRWCPEVPPDTPANSRASVRREP